MKKEKLVYASAIASILSIVFVVILTIWADLNAPLKDYLKSLSGHHWVTKSFITAILYPLFFVLLRTRKPRVNDAGTATLTLNLVAIAGFVLILAFYFFEYLK